MFRDISKAEKQVFESEFLDEVVEEEDLELEFITVKDQCICNLWVHVLCYTFNDQSVLQKSEGITFNKVDHSLLAKLGSKFQIENKSAFVEVKLQLQ